MSQTANKTTRKGSLTLFGTTSVLVISALLIAMSIVLGKLLAFNIGTSIRISLENLPILMAGIFFGPLVGAAVGAGADIIGCMIVGYSINPVITAGAALIGLVAGCVSHFIITGRSFPSVELSVLAAHFIGSMIVKSLGLYFYYGTPLKVLALRVPLYIAVGTVEAYIIYLLLKNKGFSAQLEKVTRK